VAISDARFDQISQSKTIMVHSIVQHFSSAVSKIVMCKANK